MGERWLFNNSNLFKKCCQGQLNLNLNTHFSKLLRVSSVSVLYLKQQICEFCEQRIAHFINAVIKKALVERFHSLLP